MDEKEVGSVDHYFDKISVGMIKLSDAVKVGDKVHIKGKDYDFSQDVSSMQINRVPAQAANAGDLISIKVNQKVRQGDKVYKVAA